MPHNARNLARRAMTGRVPCFALILFFLFALPSVANAANRYFVGSLDADTDSPAGAFEHTDNWSTTPCGSTGASVPGSSDVAHFSGTCGNTVTIRSAVTLNGLVLGPSFTGSLLMGTGSIVIQGTGTGVKIGSGSLVGGTGNLRVAGPFTQTGGTVEGLQATTTISGSLSITEPSSTITTSFTATGTIIFDGSADQNFIVGNGATTTLENITLQNSGGTTNDDIIVNSSGALVASGTLTITTGNFDLDTRNIALSLSGGISIANNAQATFVSDGNITLSGSITVGAAGAFNLSGSTTLTLDGIDQTLDTNNDSIYALTIGSGSGATLGADASVTNTLTVNAGSTLTISSFTLFATGATVTITNNGTIAENTGKIVHTASSFLIANSSYDEASGFNVGDTVYFTITDSDENVDGTAADTLTITVTTTTGGESETITLTETGNATGIFRGSTSSSVTSVTTGNGTLESASGEDTLTASYTDAQDGLSNTDTASFNVVSSTTSGTSGGGGGGGGGGSRRSAAVTQYGQSTGMPTARRKSSGEIVGDVQTMEETPGIGETEEDFPALPWSDLSLSHPNAVAALELHDAGIVKGNDDGTVRLNGFLNRVEALTLLMRALNQEDSPETALPFSDVNANAWYAPSLRVALAMGLIKGFPDGTFRPGEELNLVQSLKIISIALELANQEQETRALRWYDPYVAAGRQAGLVSGAITEGRTVRRGEFFSWLVKILRQRAAEE